MGSSQSTGKTRIPDFQDLADQTGFSLEQISNLHNRFKQLSDNEETISRENLERIPALENNPIRAQIIEAFFDKRNLHQDAAGSLQEIGFAEFLMVMSHFRPPPHKVNPEERQRLRRQKLRFLFNMHDTDNDGTITLDEYRKVVEDMLAKSGDMGLQTARAIADAAMLEVAKFNESHVGPGEVYDRITFDDFFEILNSLEIESKMHIRFLNMDTTTIRCGKRDSLS